MIRVFEKGDPLDIPWPEARRVAVKPNLTFPAYREGVTTSPPVLERAVAALAQRGNRVFIVESDGGCGAWTCEEALKGHGIYEIAERHGAEVLNLTKAPWIEIPVRRGRRLVQLPFSRFLAHEVDVFVTMPVPKVHCLTGVTLGMKNQWGIIPDPMRPDFHYLFNEAILEVNRKLPTSSVVADGTFFLDGNGPLDGNPLRRDLVVYSDSIGEFDRYMCAMMSIEPQRIPHLRHAMREGFVPRELEGIDFDPEQLRRLTYRSRLRRTPRNWMVLPFFHSKFFTRLVYTSQFGKLLHQVFYAIVGKPSPTKGSGH
jgi:uncharacterized protein (DUF362 family)